ncbi:MAG TPA: gamma carbonic anhydrase family protein [Dehalococcoidia bacterium]|nr:gamma carbonic anhydrase family protein [Dehalococcoidia bacterium]
MLYSFDNKRPTIGKESYVSDTALVIGDVRIGNNCYIGHGAILRGDYGTIEVGDGTAIEEGVVVHAPPEGMCSIGKKVTVGHGAIIHSKSIGDMSVIGMGAVLSVRAELGERSVAGEGAVVKADQKIPDGKVAVGNPARVVREVSSKDTDFWDFGKQFYIDLARKYLAIGMHRVD